MKIGKAIKIFRVQAGLKQQELADKAGISVSYLSLLERNKRDPVFSTLVKIAKALQVNLLVMIFMASDESERSVFTTEIQEKLSYIATMQGKAE